MPWKLTRKDLDVCYNYKQQEILQGGKSRWNMDEFIHAAAIMINFHRLAAMVESLRYSFNYNYISEEIRNFDIKKNISYNTDDKNRLYFHLKEMNEENQKKVDKVRKLSDENTTNLNYNIENVISSEPFSKFISNFYTLYMDFDPYSDTLLGNIVIYYNKGI